MMVKMEDGLKAMKKKGEVHMIFIKKDPERVSFTQVFLWFRGKFDMLKGINWHVFG
jgi:hypothetical protein